MRTSVAILEARPETVVQDYNRLLELVDFKDLCGGAAPVLVPGIRDGHWFPGRGTPPWQLDGVLKTCTDQENLTSDDPVSCLVVAPKGKYNIGSGSGWGWERILRERGIAIVPTDSREPLPYRPHGNFPALEAVLPHGLALPPALWDKPAVLMSVPGLGRIQPLFGCVDLLGRLLHLPQEKGQNKIPHSEIIAELLGYVGECLPNSIHVMDAVVWDVPAGRGGSKPVLRHVILAGRDPLAVDATAMRLLGFQPTSLSWVRLASERGAGVAKKKEISILGQPELLDLDFQKRKSTLSSLPDWDNPFWMKGEKAWARWLWQRTGRGTEIKKFRETSWGSLFETYQAG
jgi:hypothetical protein